ncbi:MAG: hypothetical protein IJW72_07330 [Alphaproteobacteria bacterium]|nr:hypothetical protein [Alphaproteobacteria bacterium]
MNKKSRIKIGSALLIIAFLFCGLANAQVPVTDSQNTKSTIKNWLTNIKESKVVVSTMNTAKKTSAAIGTAKKAVSEYVLENKKKIEVKMAKVKEYKEKVEEYKKEYEKYKAQLDEGIAKAKELKAQAEGAIQTAKDTVQTAKDTAAAAKGMAEMAKDKVSSKLGIENGGDDYVVEESVPASISEASDNATAVTLDNPTPRIAANAQAVSKIGSVAAKVASSRRPFNSVTGAVSATANINAASVEAISMAAPAVNATMENAPIMGAAQLSVGEADLKKVAPQAIVADITAKAEVQSDVVAKNTNQPELKSEELTAKPREVNKAQFDAVKLDKNSIKSAVKNNVEEDKADNSERNNSPNKNDLQAELKKLDEAKINQAPKHINNEEFNNQLKASDEAKLKALQATANKKTGNTQRKSLRRSFTTSSLEGGWRINNIIPVGFAFALELPDDCSDVNNTRIFPKATCMYCGLSSSKAKEKGAIDECLLSINAESAKAQAYSGRDAPKAYRKGKLEIAAAMIAESYRAANKAETFYDNKVAPIAEASENIEQDALANLVEFNKVVNEQLNDLMQLYSSKLALTAYSNYGDYKFKPEEKEDEE